MTGKSEWLDRFFNITPDIVYFIDLEGRLQHWNAALEKLCGLPSDKMKGRPCVEFVCEQDKSVVVADVQKVFANGSHANIYRFIRSDGALIPFHCNGTVTFNERGDPDGFAGLGRDISERRLAEEKLHQQKQFSDDIINSLPGIFYMLDQQGRILRVNSKFFEISGFSKEELERITTLDLFEGDDKKLIAQRMQEVFELGESFGEGDLVTKSGRKIPYSFTGHRTSIDGQPYLIGLGTDITNRKTQEWQLAQQGFALNHVNEAAYLMNDRGRFLYVNEEACRVLGYTRDELLGGMGVSDIGSGWTGEKWAEHWRDIKTNGFRTLEAAHQAKDGHMFPIEVSANYFEYDGQGYVMSMVRDITGRKQAEKLLQDSMRKMEEKELAKSRFLAAAGHDLRQPLSAANLFIDALKYTGVTPDQNQIIQRLDQAMSNFNDLLGALLNVSKLDSGVIKPEFTSVDLGDIFNWLDESFTPLASEKHIRFRLHFPVRKAIVVRCDIGLVKSVLMNLVSNAIKFTSKGGVLVSARRRGDNVLFQVWDTGIGIQGEDIEKIFDDFYQINNPQRDRTSGLGLGLSIAKRTLALFDETITCRSRVECGSVFEFLLPMGQSSNVKHAITTSETLVLEANRSFVRGKRFVVIEDDAMVAEALSKSLELMGGAVECFVNAEYALQHANIGNADCYIVDYMLPGDVDGINFLLRLHQILHKPICAVMMSGNTSSYFIRKAELFDWPVIPKPINMTKLISRLSEQLDEKA